MLYSSYFSSTNRIAFIFYAVYKCLQNNMHLLLYILGLAFYAVAMPGMAAYPAKVKARQSLPSNLPLSSEEGNSGPIPSLIFDPDDQFVDVRPGTEHQFIAPTSADERGPCPGLNAAANHGFLPRNGIATIDDSKSYPTRPFCTNTHLRCSYHRSQ